jgi:hypothetical protein
MRAKPRDTGAFCGQQLVIADVTEWKVSVFHPFMFN